MNVPGSPKLPFSLMAKPIGSACNLDCTYCYYLEKGKLYPGEPHQRVMSDKILETYIAQSIYSSLDPVVQFAWHGGEPVMIGMEFFRKVIRLQKKHGGGRVIGNSLQTNGTMLTDEWCSFFRDHDFLVDCRLMAPNIATIITGYTGTDRAVLSNA